MGFLSEVLKRFLGSPLSTPTPPPPPPKRAAITDESRLRTHGLPVIRNQAELASSLNLKEGELKWLADGRRLAAEKSPHYRAILRPKKKGQRVILAPRKRLKLVQRWILRNILDMIPPSSWSHGFTAARGIKSNAAQHTGRDVIVQVDIKDFFHQFTLKSVTGLFRYMGYSIEVSRTLGLLCTAPVRQMMRTLAGQANVSWTVIHGATGQGKRNSHHPMLPQGAPTSPALANLLCRRLDRRFAGLAKRFQAQYSRYADDLTFSGGSEFRRDLRRFVPLVLKIIRQEKMQPAPGKLRFARKGGRQTVTGLIVNRRVNIPAGEYRTLRAILHNCLRKGPASQNRENHPKFREHLQGRIAHVNHVNPEKGAFLRSAFDRITW